MVGYNLFFQNLFNLKKLFNYEEVKFTKCESYEND